MSDFKNNKSFSNSRKKTSLKTGYTAVNLEIITKIKNEIARTGVNPRALVKFSNYEDSFYFIYKVLCRSQKSISEEKLKLIYDLYEKLPSKTKSSPKRSIREGYVAITAKTIEEIESHIERTGLSIHSFINLYGLNYIGIQKVEHWVKGRAKSAPAEHIQILLNTWETVPANFYITILPEMSDFVNKEIKRTGFGAYKILRGNKKAKENGITASQIHLVTNGSSKKMKATMLHQILALWQNITDKS